MDSRRPRRFFGARGGFAARAGHYRIGDLARELTDIAQEGLIRLGRVQAGEGSEVDLLERVVDRVGRGRTAADEAIEIWKLGGANRVRDLVDHAAYSGSRQQ